MKRLLPYLLASLLIVPTFVLGQSWNVLADRPNILKYDLMSGLEDNSFLNLSIERFLLKDAISLEIGVVRLNTGPLDDLPPAGKYSEDDTDIGGRGSSRRVNLFYSDEYNVEGISVYLGPKFFFMNLGEKERNFFFKGLYLQPLFYYNQYTSDYFRSENTYTGCREDLLIFSTTYYDVFTTYFENESGQSVIGVANLGYEITLPGGFHADLSFGLRATLSHTSQWSESAYKNPYARLALGYAF